MGKKAAQTRPNPLLRRARLERGWTQKLVAERIGAPNDVIVTRWERGTAFPSPHYVQQLCQLFEQPASELGLLKEVPARVIAPPPARLSPGPAALQGPRSAASAPVAPLSPLPLVGRSAELQTLEICYRHAQQGQMQVVLLRGEAGVGKTRLASTFLSWAAQEGAVLLEGRTFEMGGRLPYQPLVHALSRRLEEEPSPEALLSAAWLSELSRILPQLWERYPTLPPGAGDDMTGRIRLFEALTRLVQAFGAQRPVVFLIDDVQWADTASLDVLHYAGQRWRESGTPLLLVLAIRAEALAMPGPLSQWVAVLQRDVSVVDLTLGPLTLSETHHLLSALGAGESSPHPTRLTEMGQWLFRETQGQPFYLVETLQALRERGIITLRGTPPGEVFELDMTALRRVEHERMLPPGVRRLIQAQLEHLSPMGRTLLMASALLEQGSSFELLSGVAQLETGDALVALEETLGQGLLREERARRGTEPYYLLRHDKIREVIMTEMGEAQRQHLHRRALQVLEAEGRPVAELAHHALAGGLPEQAVHLSLAAGDEAVHLFAHTEAQSHYTQALEALSQLPAMTTTQSTRVETLLKLVQICWMAVDVARTLSLLAEAEELARTLHDQRQLALIHYWTGVVSSSCTALRHARPAVEQVLAEAQALGDEELVALASVQLSRVLDLQGRYSTVEALLTPAIPVLERAANWQAWTDALGYLGIAQAARGQCAAGLALGQCALERAQRSGEVKHHHGIRARHFLSIISLFSGDCSYMLKESEQIVQEAGRIGDWLLVYWAYGFRSWTQSHLGQYDDALQSMARAREAGNHLGEHLMGQDILEAVTAEILLATGRAEEALACAEATITLAREEVDGLLSTGLAERVCAQALAQLSRWEEAKRHLAASVQILRSGEALLEVARTRVVWGLLCRDHHERAAAQAHLEQACVQFEASGLTHDRDTVQRSLTDLVQS
ncbi:MAG: AAA family ATPase [Ktedonobacteraceae bacterium]|nr:AAA family ATPase [Ktedonobacteraceae bacterium]